MIFFHFTQKRLNRNNISSIILTATILVLIGINAYLLFGYVSCHTAITNNTTPLIDPARRFYAADDLIINVQPLRDYFSDKYESDQNVSIYFEYLPTGANISINKDAEFYPASLLKLPIAMAVAKTIERGDYKWSNTITLQESDKNNDFGDLWQQPVGKVFTVEELVRELLINSDNTAQLMLLRNLDQIDQNELFKVHEYLGLLDFFTEDGKISAKKYSPILRSLYSASYLTVENSGKILQLMSESNFNNFLTAGLPKNVKLAHKIGVNDEENVYLDAGIVYPTSRPFILIVMVKNYDLIKTQEIIKDISQKAYNYIADYPQSAIK